MLISGVNYMSIPHGDQPSARREPPPPEVRPTPQAALPLSTRLINVVPVGLKEAALDSPTSRASVIFFAEQVDFVEKWLEDYMRSTNRLIAESSTLENTLNYYTSHVVIPMNISEAVLDQDYSLLAMRKYSESAKDYWMSILSVVRRLNALVVEPIRLFLQKDIRPFKDVRRNLDQCQKSFDNLQSKFASQTKSREPSSLREDAFQLHESRKAYLKASMDFFLLAPQLRFALDKLLVRIFFEQWREMRISRDNSSATFARNAQEMERVKGWARGMENGELAFKRELLAVRRELEEAAELKNRPSRELDDYALSTIPSHVRHVQSGSVMTAGRSPSRPSPQMAEKQGWLYLRTYTGRPTRTVWVRRWAFVKRGIFGWLLQGARAGTVEESEHIGVLLCNVRAAVGEERRFCFEVKTKKHAIMLQTETQSDLVEWIGVFENAKSKALDDSRVFEPVNSNMKGNTDPAFAISAPPIPEFGTTVLNMLDPNAGDDAVPTERSNTLPPLSLDVSKDGTDVTRRSMTIDKDELLRESTSRLGKKLDLHRKSTINTQISGSPSTSVGGGIASLIAASHGSMPVGPGLPITPVDSKPGVPKSSFTLALRDMPSSTLAPSSLANPPAPTGLSKTAVIVTGERALGAGVDRPGGITNGMMANVWGSMDSVATNRLGVNDSKATRNSRPNEQFPRMATPSSSPAKPVPSSQEEKSGALSITGVDLPAPSERTASRAPSPGKRHRNTISLDQESAKQTQAAIGVPDFPNNYPLQLKTQDAQFRLLFPGVRKDERLALVFRASWNPNDQQDFPGRAYVTTQEIYFYSHHFGLVLATNVALSAVDEVTAAPGRDCDFLFLHLKEPKPDGTPTRITIKTFLEPLKLLQKRLNFLVRSNIAEPSQSLEVVIKMLLKMEHEAPERSPSLESWEDVALDTPADDGPAHKRDRSMTTLTDYKAPIRVDRTLGQANKGGTAPGKEITKFKLPAQPVNYTPPGNPHLAVEKCFDVSPKALFHVLFGDKSAVWQLLQHERRAQNLKQGPWLNMGEGRFRRYFDFNIPTADVLGRDKLADVRDYQVVDVNNDHLCYVVTDKRTAWHLPFRKSYRLVSKIVITHMAKGKCKMAVFTRVEWEPQTWLARQVIGRHAMYDLNLDALDLVDLATDQVRRLGPHSRTKTAVEIFGQLGQLSEIAQLQIDRTALNIELRRTPVERSTLELLTENVTTFTESALTSAFEVVSIVLRWAYKTCSANSLILVMLVLSLMFNSYHSYRDMYTWYHERSAGNFMMRLGVSPNHIMSKAVYARDMDDMLSLEFGNSTVESSSCYALFQNELRTDDLDAPAAPAEAMRATRQRLGTYRHDLLVAMRVVNSIEAEVILAEWEDWVAAENRRCQQVKGLLNITDIPGSVHSTDESGPVQEWYDDYCMSCKRERERLAHR